RKQAKQDSFEILTKKFRGTYGKMKEIPSNVPVALKGTTNQSRHTSYKQGMCKVSFQELNNEVL
ncbi:type III-A CRISPR-associated RAMP protein Csm5, partial [Staphylococcus epidermidis]